VAARRPSERQAAQERRRRIVEGTRELLREREAAKVIVIDIAQRAGVAPATVYNLVGARDEVLRAVLDDAVDDLSARLEPADPSRPSESIVSVLTTAAHVLRGDARAYRRAIGAMSDVGDRGWLTTTVGDVLEVRLTAVGAAFDGSIPLARLAETINIGFRGVLISWSYGHVTDEELASRGEEHALHVLGTTARPHIAFDIKRRLIALAKETP